MLIVTSRTRSPVQNAPAAAMLGFCRHLRGIQSWGPVSQAEIAVALHLARQAIETGREDPDALWMAAFTLSHLAGEHAVAAGVLGRALALNPN